MWSVLGGSNPTINPSHAWNHHQHPQPPPPPPSMTTCNTTGQHLNMNSMTIRLTRKEEVFGLI